MVPTPPRVYCGIDTHADTHHAAILTDTGILLANRQFNTTTLGYDDLVAWVRDHGDPIAVGVEGTSSYGAGITRHLRHHDNAVVEVPRPNRKLRRSKGKSDPIDAGSGSTCRSGPTPTLRTQKR
ncbi:IS110 family transposase [Rhodococcus sp. USK13]|uniref:IS110 family transposase n=1 Tax=Rhodococcus sp. USK13 TaxID=2806442 RepID=UPI002016E258|nr:IS110 family transposase [Rhodococcus sp. USK13]